MSFDNPLILIPALLIALGIGLLIVAGERRMTARDLLYSNIAFLSGAVQPRAWIAILFRAVWIAGLAAGAIALAGPHLRMPVPVKDGSVFVCIDTSGSMRSTDVAPTRADAAKAAAAAFIDAAPAGTRIGIIAFSNRASIIAPLSADHAAVKAALENLPPPNGATAIGDALALAQQSLPPAGHRVIVLVTDGVNNVGVDPQEVSQTLGSRHIPVYTIGIGTQNGDIIGGEQATIDEGALQSYADASGGAYARAATATQLRSALATLGRTTTVSTQNVPLSFPLAIGAAALFVLALVTGLVTGRVP